MKIIKKNMKRNVVKLSMKDKLSEKRNAMSVGLSNDYSLAM